MLQLDTPIAFFHAKSQHHERTFIFVYSINVFYYIDNLDLYVVEPL